MREMGVMLRGYDAVSGGGQGGLWFCKCRMYGINVREFDDLDFETSHLTETERQQLGARCALRVLPFFWAAENVPRFEAVALAALRQLLSVEVSSTTSAYSVFPYDFPHDFLVRHEHTFDYDIRPVELLDRDAAHRVECVWNCIGAINPGARQSIGMSAQWEASVLEENEPTSALLKDIALVSETDQPLGETSLWPGTGPHEDVGPLLARFPGGEDGKDDGWGFWRRWYRGALYGSHLHPDLQRDVASIPNRVWDAGVVTLAREIARIELIHELKQEIVALKAQLNSAQATETAPNRLHNQPPEAVEEEAQVVRREITLVWQQVEALEDEIAKPDPSASVLLGIANALWSASLKIAGYCAELGDTALRSTAKWAGPVGAAYLATPDGLQRISRLATELAKAIAGG